MLTCPHCNHIIHPESPTPNKITPDQIVTLYNEYAAKNKWQKVNKLADATKKKLSAAIKELPSLDEWTLVMRGLEADKFFSGSSSDYKTNIQTIIFKSRYMDFYNAGLDTQGKESVDDILSSLKALL
jgi:hypothetical protein